MGGGRPSIPSDFAEKLRLYNPQLHIEWSEKKKRFLITQCDQHLSATNEHTHICRRSYVWLVRDEEDNNAFMPLGDHVIEKLKSFDLRVQGYGPEDHARWCADRAAEDKANREEIERKQKESVVNARKDNRRQLLRAIHLMQKHTMEPH